MQERLATRLIVVDNNSGDGEKGGEIKVVRPLYPGKRVLFAKAARL